MSTEKKCVYTVLMNNYEILSEQQKSKESGIDFYCFTDNSELTSDTWNIVYTPPIFPKDASRSARVVKICPHRFLKEYDLSLYIDNSVQLLEKPEIIFDDLISPSDDIVMMQHSFRETVLAEFFAVDQLKYDTSDVIDEQLKVYSEISPQIFNQKPYWGGFIIRRHNVTQIINAMDDWISQVLRYSRRDQLSINYIIDKYKLNINIQYLDNRISRYHKWPVATRLDTPVIKNRVKHNVEYEAIALKLKKELDDCKQQLLSLENSLKENDALNSEIITYALSNSWKMTRPFRKLFAMSKRLSKPR